MMNDNPTPCPVLDTELLAFRDRELGASRQAELAAHVEECHSCQARLAQADLVTATLTLGSPLRDQPVARAAVHDRIAGDRAAWWRHRVLIGTGLPVALLLLVVVGFNRWMQDDTCESCPPLPAPMQVTAISGLPAGWGSLLPCQAAAPSNQSRNQNAQNPPAARPLAGPASGTNAQRQVLAPPQANRQSGAEQQQASRQAAANRLAAANAPDCAPGTQARQPGLNDWSEGDMVWSNQPGT